MLQFQSIAFLLLLAYSLPRLGKRELFVSAIIYLYFCCFCSKEFSLSLAARLGPALFYFGDPSAFHIAFYNEGDIFQLSTLLTIIEH